MAVPSPGLGLSGNAGEDYVNTGFNVRLLMLQAACTGKALGTMDREMRAA